jgi:hypothetical protein
MSKWVAGEPLDPDPVPNPVSEHVRAAAACSLRTCAFVVRASRPQLPHRFADPRRPLARETRAPQFARSLKLDSSLGAGLGLVFSKKEEMRVSSSLGGGGRRPAPTPPPKASFVISSRLGVFALATLRRCDACGATAPRVPPGSARGGSSVAAA